MLRKIVLVVGLVLIALGCGERISERAIDWVPDQLFWRSFYGHQDFFVGEVVRFSDEIPGTGMKMAAVLRWSAEDAGVDATCFGILVPINSPIKLGDDVEVFYAHIFNNDRVLVGHLQRFVRPRGDGSAPELPPAPR